MPSAKRKLILANKRQRKEQAMKNPGHKSKYAQKVARRASAESEFYISEGGFD
jgi:hypothetical protein